MQTPALLVLAAGMGSRYGGLKQIDPLGPNGEIIIDYSVHDAILAGFGKVVFVIKRELEDTFRQVIGSRFQDRIQVEYAYQDLDDLPGGFVPPAGRTKPWGTGQAVLAAKSMIDSPFAVINADDYYGKSIYTSIHDYLCADHGDSEFCMAGFVLKNTLSDNGGVTRGICQVENGFLTNVTETHNILPTPTGARADDTVLDPDSFVSMNMWGLTPDFLHTLETNFEIFFREDVPQNPLKAEYLLPILIGHLLQKNEISVQVLPTQDKWFGVTYAADKLAVTESFRALIDAGVYREDLYSDL